LVEAFEAPNTIRRMLIGAMVFLDSLRPDQRAIANYPMDHPGRTDWDPVPKPDRTGIPLSLLDRHQKTLAHNLVAAGLSTRGYSQALSIMALEDILREHESPDMGVVTGTLRSSEQYFVSIFGRPGFEDTWTWRFLGHHLSLSYTIVDQRYLAVTPCSMGAQPAVAGVLAPLREDQDLGFALLHGMTAGHRARAVIHDVAPPGFTTRQVPFVGKVEYPDDTDLESPWYQINDADREALKFVKDQPRGVPGSELPLAQAQTLMDLVQCYVSRLPEEVSERQFERVQADGLENLWFCWAGGQEKGTSHYYRIQGRQILIEFDNAVDKGNHIHSVWRDYRNDLGHDLLLDHDEQQRTHGDHLATRFESSVPEDDAPPHVHTHEHGHVHTHDHTHDR
jgi:hypothetical protein